MNGPLGKLEQAGYRKQSVGSSEEEELAVAVAAGRVGAAGRRKRIGSGAVGEEGGMASREPVVGVVGEEGGFCPG